MRFDSFGRPIADNRNISLSDYLSVNEEVQEETPADRLRQNPLVLMLRAIGSPSVIVNKTHRFVVTLFNTFYLTAQNKRLRRLHEIGFIERIPTLKQLWFGAYDMLRYFISPGAASYYKTKGINFTFHSNVSLIMYKLCNTSLRGSQCIERLRFLKQSTLNFRLGDCFPANVVNYSFLVRNDEFVC